MAQGHTGTDSDTTDTSTDRLSPLRLVVWSALAAVSGTGAIKRAVWLRPAPHVQHRFPALP